ANLPEAPSSAPNVLLIVWDTVRAESMSLYGYERQTTPYLEDLAKEGTVFRNAIATASWTLPSHASLFTGRYHHETLTSYYKPLDATYPTLAEDLATHGYITGGFVANTEYCCAERGIARGFVHYEDYVASIGELERSSSLIRSLSRQSFVRLLFGYRDVLGRKSAPRIGNDFLRWVDHIPNGRSFFAFLNYYDAHQPYIAPAEFDDMFGPTDRLVTYISRYSCGVPCSSDDTPTDEIESMRNAYDGSIAYLDSNLKWLFGELKRRNLLDRTLVILVADHGEEFAGHSTIGHGKDLYIQSIRVPLILRLPGSVPRDVVVQEPITLRDMPATVIDLLSLPDEGLFPGRSLRSHWLEPGGNTPKSLVPALSELSYAPWEPNSAPVSKGDMRSLVTGDMHYIRSGDGTEEVYDLRTDPAEHNDLIRTPRGAEAVAQAKRILEQMR
ncbi:MAG: sulfatase, partial [Sedimentisphaerales bacterium]